MPTRPVPAAVTIVAQDVGPRRGMESCLRHLVAGLRELGHRVTVVARTCELPMRTWAEPFNSVNRNAYLPTVKSRNLGLI